MKRRMNGYLLAGLIVTGLMAALILVGLVWTPLQFVIENTC